MPISPETTLQPQEFLVLLLRRIWQPLPLASFTCRGGRPFVSRGHPRAACPLAGEVGAPRICVGERSRFRLPGGGGEWVTTIVWVQDMDVFPLRQDRTRWSLMAPFVAGCAACHRHHYGVSSPVGRDGATSVRNCQRSSLGSSQEAERADLPRAGSAARSRPASGAGLRGGWTTVRGVVSGDQGQV